MGKIKRVIQLFLLRRAMKKLEYERRVVGYDKAKNIALLFDAGTDGRPVFISQIINKLRNDGKLVSALGFFNQKRIPEGIKSIDGVSYCSKRSFSLWMQPGSETVKAFVKKPYELMIDLTIDDSFMVKYVAGITKAFYKAGAHHPDYLSVYDLLLHIDHKTTDEKLADYAVHYLKIIKTPEEK